jgi:cystathionine gamma-lyase
MPDLADLVARMLHRGAEKRAPGDLVVPPIVPASTYHLPGDPAGPFQYGRWSNPTWNSVEDALGLLEGAHVITVPSGMGAVSAVMYALLKHGDRILLPSDGYGATRAFAEQYLKPMGITIDLAATCEVETRDLSRYRLVWIETPSNPGLDLCNIAAVAAKTKAIDALLVADNTTMTPLGQRPLDLGADIVVSSDTKLINGHSDTLFGHVATRDESIAARVRDWRKMAGAIPSPFDAWLVHRGLETLELRVQRMWTSAATLAARLAEHPKIKALAYPGLPDHPAHNLARAQMTAFGSLVALTFASKDTAERFISGCRFVRPATSFGSLHTSAERRQRWGDAVPDGFVRLSVGCEPVDALWSAMRESLDAL